MAAYEGLLLAAVVLAALEVVTGTYVALGMAIGCTAVAAAMFVTGGMSPYRDVALFAVAASLAVLGLRWAFARPGDSKPAQGDVNEY